ncbi:MAG: hypothetical protein ABJH07_23490, partial [Sedimentitalea sp.]|uniref:hypothetical protein n=1 Tax=Sedimentitalea sp. TaxID=2048915 RepID=UPI0032985381
GPVRDAVLCFGDLIATGIIEFVGHGPSLASEKTMGIPRPGDPCNTLGHTLFQWNDDHSLCLPD